jgi:hypothetical protein
VKAIKQKNYFAFREKTNKFVEKEGCFWRNVFLFENTKHTFLASTAKDREFYLVYRVKFKTCENMIELNCKAEVDNN